MKSAKSSRPEASPSPSPPRVAVLDMGATAVRMAVAEILPRGRYHTLESLQQSVSIGKDTFAGGAITRSTTEACVKALRHFRAVLASYRLEPCPPKVRAIATSAVREAVNRDAFLDRILLGTGFDVEPIDEAEASHYTFLGVRHSIERHPVLRKKDTLVVDVGGGSTEVLLVRNGSVVFSATYGLGALRLRERLEEAHAPPERIVRLIEGQIQQTVARIGRQCAIEAETEMLALGHAALFAAGRNAPGRTQQAEVLSAREMQQQADHGITLPIRELVRRYQLALPDAETLGPALLTYARLAGAFRIPRVHIGRATLRDGLLAELAGEGLASREVETQVLHTARVLAGRYRVDPVRADTTRRLAARLFRALSQEHKLSPRHGLLLQAAALLCDTGLYLSNRSHHKHSMYLILHSDLFGLSGREQRLVALTARYHRRAPPRPAHDEYNRLPREDRLTVCKLAALLRIADALSQGGLHDPGSLSFELKKDRLDVRVPAAEDLALEQLALQERSDLFEQVYGMGVSLRARPLPGKES